MSGKGNTWVFLIGIAMLLQVIMIPGMVGPADLGVDGDTTVDSKDDLGFDRQFGSESLKGSALPPAPAGQVTVDDIIYYEDKYAILINGGAESRYWVDMTTVYETLVDVHGFDPANVYLLNYNGKDPDGNPDPRIDGNGTIPDVISTFQYIESVADENDLVMVWVTDHGRGYSGTASPFYGYVDGEASVDPGDEEDYLESDWKLRSLFTGGNYRRNHGLNEWAIRYKFVSSDNYSMYRNMYMSNFDNKFTIETGVISDNDVYIEEFKDYLEGDFNKDGYLDTSIGEVYDFDGDTNPPYNETTMTYDEDDWGSIDNYTDNHNKLYTKVPGSNYTIFDAGLDNTLDLDINYYSSALEIDGTDIDNAGLFDGIDVNEDGDMMDWVSIDEMLVMPGNDMTDDEFADGVRNIKALRTTYVFLPCFSGGFIDDLSGINRAIATATVEELTSGGNAFIRNMANAFKYEKSSGIADINGDGNVSFTEAFIYTSGTISWDVPQYDDNGDAVGRPTPLDLSQDGRGNVNVTVNFTNYMNTSLPLNVTFGINPPFDAYAVAGSWVTNSIWEGSFTVTAPMPEGTYHFNVSGGKDFTGVDMRPEIDYIFEIDKTPPTGTIVINSDDVYANSTSVNLALTATGISGIADMRFSDDNASWSSWEPFAISKSYVLPSGDGTKTVYVQYRDNAGLVSTGTISDDIILDTTQPTGTMVINSDDAYATSTSVTLTLSANDFNGIAGMRFSDDGASWSSWEPFAISRAYTLASGDGTKTIYVHYEDSAGLISVIINDGDAKTNSTSVQLSLTFSDVNVVVDMRFSNDGTSWSSWESVSATKSYVIPSGEGLKTVYVQYRDTAGLVSTATIMDDITYEEPQVPEPPDDPPDEPPGNETEPPDDNNTTPVTNQDGLIWALVLAIVIIVTVSFAILLYWRRKKQ
jgi:hypothetical protein